MKKFIQNAASEKEANVIAFGVPLGKNSKEVLSFLREISWFVEPFDVEKKRNLLEKVKVYDIGDVEIKENPDRIFEQTFKIVNDGKIPLILGKSHLLTFYTLGGMKEGVRVVIFDAHADLADEYFDEKVAESTQGIEFENGKRGMARYNCYTWLRRFCELAGTRNICLLGIRSCSEEELNFIEENKILYFTSTQIRENFEEVRKNLAKFVEGSDVYVSLDIDFFDPSIAPAVDFPTPNGLFFPDFLKILEILKGKVAGIDLVEFSLTNVNKIDEITGVIATQSVLEILDKIK